MDKPEYPPAGTWDVIDRHGEPRYVVEHDGNGGWWGVCQPDRPEDCYVLAASKQMYDALQDCLCWLSQIPVDWTDSEAQSIATMARGACEKAKEALRKAEGK